eukprot:TRINITY_DN72435_c0_g1_i1.p1 TRINITY_DN72435_c0_g1~~TRINITY_DN72435_c0_g1_i1.p1  ORF type:complete len:667 (+),score=140.46 TRINITY_DN72435_c0_g1_i1:69-2003(+)
MLGLLLTVATLQPAQAAAAGCDTTTADVCPRFWAVGDSTGRRPDGSPEAEANIISDLLGEFNNETEFRWVLKHSPPGGCRMLRQKGCECEKQLLSTNGTSLPEGAVIRYDPTRAPSDDDIVGVGDSTTSGTTVVVSATMVKIGPLNSASKTVNFFLHLKLQWNDPRLRWCPDNYTGFGATTNASEPYISMLSHVASTRIWRPDILFPHALRNGQGGRSEWELWGEEYTRIRHDGTVYFSKMVSMPFSCPMNFQWYPFDTQLCTFELRSYGYTGDVMQFKLADKYLVFDRNQDLEAMLQIGTFELIAVKGESVKFNDSTGPWYDDDTGSTPGIRLSFALRRTFQPYALTAFLPLILVVVLSCGAMWIDPRAAPARVGAGVTTVLVMISLMFVISKDLPLTNRLTAMDVYVVVCFLVTALNMVQYGVVNYVTTRVETRKTALRNKQQHLAVIRNALLKYAPQLDIKKPHFSHFAALPAPTASQSPASPLLPKDSLRSKQDIHQEAVQMFTDIVGVGETRISVEEFADILGRPDDLRLLDALRRMDSSGDGIVSKDEFCAFLKELFSEQQLRDTDLTQAATVQCGPKCCHLNSMSIARFDMLMRFLSPCFFLTWNIGFFAAWQWKGQDTPSWVDAGGIVQTLTLSAR